MEKKRVRAPEILNEATEYNKSFSRGLRFEVGGATFIMISGTASIDEHGQTFAPGEFTQQAERTYRNITALLSSEGADWHDVVHTRCYIKDMKYYDEFNDYRNRLYRQLGLDPFPASVCVQAHLCRPELLIEIEALAVKK